MTGNYDKDTKTIYWGVGNAAPWPGDAHPGDNLYTTSVLGLDPETGKIKTHFQYHPNDSWDWDEVEAPILVDLQRDGRTIKSLIHPGRERDLLGPGAQAGQDQLRSRLALCLHRCLERH